MRGAEWGASGRSTRSSSTATQAAAAAAAAVAACCGRTARRSRVAVDVLLVSRPACLLAGPLAGRHGIDEGSEAGDAGVLNQSALLYLGVALLALGARPRRRSWSWRGSARRSSATCGSGCSTTS